MIVNDQQQYEQYHIYPTHGLLNDPNGLVYFKGQYHVFYQWNPHATNHKYKVWAHVVSDDLRNWERLPIALEPSLAEDQGGVYSGTALVVAEKLYLFYTGNVRNDAGESIASYQMAAVSDDGIHFEKLGKLFDQPAGYTRHVRDPKILHVDKMYYLLLGAQRQDLTGDIIIYSSPNLKDWQFRGSLLDEQLPAFRGYMIECPDLLFIDNQAVLAFSPQGLAADGNHLQNIYNTGYVLGGFDAENAKFKVHGAFQEFDNGFEFYAAQSLTHHARTLLWGWAGIMPPEREQTLPTIGQGWAHVLSLPRDLTIQDRRLHQNPLPEMGIFKLVNTTNEISGPGLWELPATADKWLLNLTSTFQIERQADCLTMRRRQWESGIWETRIIEGDLASIKLVIDTDIVEIYAGKGAFVMTARYFNN
ncbi:glycoside hydrolase family 32 protein [Periweissella ghanensis]|uniref:Sucrose-6-phosphate hydrolase n=1 Tax=Periweissella ghanensis TaxID=467997 RepID=A0ABM8Z9I8_9LACO|nr:glycoside hydrolase family 32 protein [Periweissella ghanensis]CAH0417975.1 Sucrose-6-phosphate hydrolase [Periweissella ghanensis]